MDGQFRKAESGRTWIQCRKARRFEPCSWHQTIQGETTLRLAPLHSSAAWRSAADS